MRQKLFAIFLLGLVGLNYPVLSLFGKEELIFKIPALYFFLYSVWFILIVFSAWVIEKKKF
ncbi:MAG: hypothetical protein HN351_03605 [Deltaproteobacteria bacterium]|jgi:hypothetical protein|nr:hypothetical protein [Deltaproteobacteria bacterium]